MKLLRDLIRSDHSTLSVLASGEGWSETDIRELSGDNAKFVFQSGSWVENVHRLLPAAHNNLAKACKAEADVLRRILAENGNLIHLGSKLQELRNGTLLLTLKEKRKIVDEATKIGGRLEDAASKALQIWLDFHGFESNCQDKAQFLDALLKAEKEDKESVRSVISAAHKIIPDGSDGRVRPVMENYIVGVIYKEEGYDFPPAWALEYRRILESVKRRFTELDGFGDMSQFKSTDL
jgi:hypothetical protein